MWPSRKFQCVYSEELLPNRGCREDNSGAMAYGKAVVNGAMCHITAIFGMTLAGLILDRIYRLTPKTSDCGE